MKTTQAAATQTQRLLTHQVILRPLPSRSCSPARWPQPAAAAAKAAEAGRKPQAAAAAVRTVSDTTSKAARNAMVAVQAAARVVEGEWIGGILYPRRSSATRSHRRSALPSRR